MISKKKYTKPQVEKMDIDNEISLVMASIPDWPATAAESTEGDKVTGGSPGDSMPPSYDNDPFGGSTPDYK